MPISSMFLRASALSRRSAKGAGPRCHGHRQALRVGRVCAYQVCRRQEWQAEAVDHAMFVVTAIASRPIFPRQKNQSSSGGLVITDQPVLALKPPSGLASILFS
jgi:hypothetical protein